MEEMSRVEEILAFWFGKPRDDQAYYQERSAVWFASNPEFDQEIRDRFAIDYHAAAAQKLMAWQDAPRSGLALVILLDQFPRNIFRGESRAFAADPLAREVATYLIQVGFDQQLLPAERSFVYLPFMHSENVEDQRRSVALFRQLAQERPYISSLSFATKHLEVIECVGRFPHRNAVLGRLSTPAEVEFLQRAGSSL
jgi:uncharacterized protein (DUF924 family)